MQDLATGLNARQMALGRRRMSRWQLADCHIRRSSNCGQSPWMTFNDLTGWIHDAAEREDLPFWRVVITIQGRAVTVAHWLHIFRPPGATRETRRWFIEECTVAVVNNNCRAIRIRDAALLLDIVCVGNIRQRET